MKLTARVLRKCCFLYNQCIRRLYRERLRASVSIANGRLRIADSVTLTVPVRCNGSGEVILKDGVKLGYALAPKIGDGGILLQARDKEAVIEVGEGTATSNNISLVAKDSITVGKDCLIGDMVSIMDSDFHGILPEERHRGGQLLQLSLVITSGLARVSWFSKV